jgi:hypothetical protein
MGTCGKAAENGAFGSCFRDPFRRSSTRRLAALTFFRPWCAQRASTAEPLLTHPPHLSPSSEGLILGSTSSVSKMDLSPSTLRIMARGIYRTVLPTGLRPRLPIHRRPLNSGVNFLFSRTHASSHERTTVATPPYPFSSTLDRTRVPICQTFRCLPNRTWEVILERERD